MNLSESQHQNNADDKPSKGAPQNNKENLIGILEILGGIVFAIIGVAFSDVGFHFGSLLFYFLAVGCTIGILAHYAKQSGFRHAARLFWGLMALDFLLFAFLILKSEFPPPEPKPFFTPALQISGSSPSTLLLTNDCFFLAGIENTITNFSNKFLIFNGVPNACIVIPLQPGESNKVFNFIIENNSPVKVNDLEVIVGFLNEWKLGLNSEKWHPEGEHFSGPGYRRELTELQFWVAQSPAPLFPGDSMTFPPITNFCPPDANQPTNRIGQFRLTIRSTGFMGQLSANILFPRVPSNSFPTFVTTLDRQTNGIWRISLPTNIFGVSAK